MGRFVQEDRIGYGGGGGFGGLLVEVLPALQERATDAQLFYDVTLR